MLLRLSLIVIGAQVVLAQKQVRLFERFSGGERWHPRGTASLGPTVELESSSRPLWDRSVDGTGYYQLGYSLDAAAKAPDSFISTPLCRFAGLAVQESIVLHTLADGATVAGLAHTTSAPPNACDLPSSSISMPSTRISSRPPAIIPDIVLHEPKAEVEFDESGQEKVPPKPQTFLQKYWWYIIPLLLLLVMSGPQEEPKAGAAAAGARPAART
ncbi:hypothetical protein E5Q_01354 [Mixia osmundae IAM 14324]|uniref:ER membrane protein complex subunit 10 n=1 Tax=Mixia osmundae (strain CBS 9802 / IAM 14324 / JCM 22182 / KY 12970) TaxID=764103 RepID=G7DVU1_MIXOS|nr:hypothetical protein E5Q_01354 [Mixia osmundae IAM 14324]